ncbi:DUF72 domain-containing protein [Vagococcus vulneris]|uniref:DUF72 domain-containing protein n=1 Tax=Vagococcus vulneris TaxID=1977869 RepID=A0A429ZY19_9ENTE|nr:DUF72 domain-containing protein [Vagococcus vulneris]RST98795.1 hypothetical protein CBF37_07035 [Vagococcus vulneris]
MIAIGLTTFHEHEALMHKNKMTLAEYASFFPIVELNTSFYGIKPASVSQHWSNQTPDSFKFIVKAYKGMTQHADWHDSYSSENDMYTAYADFIEPLIRENKLLAVLCQFPGYFACTKESVAWLSNLRRHLPDVMLAVEFRHQSWYSETNRESMLNYMRDNRFSLVAADEPQVPIRSIPFLPVVTNPELFYIRLHGRHKGNWLDNSGDWRKKRNLYRYSDEELAKLAQTIQCNSQVKNQAVIFNNNSAGDAAPNALTLKKLLGIEYHGLNPNQLSLF